jgi:hypothetical protein
LKRIPKGKTKIVYAGLPGRDIVFEKLLAQQEFATSAILFEKESSLIPLIQEQLDDLSDKTNRKFTSLLCHSNMTNLRQLYTSCDIVWYDYCGPISYERILSLWLSVVDLRDHDCVYAFTFMVGREIDVQDTLQKIISEEEFSSISDINSPSLKRIAWLNAVVKNALRHCGISAEIEAFIYKDTVPMVSLVLRKASKTTLVIKPLDKEFSEQSSLQEEIVFQNDDNRDWFEENQFLVQKIDELLRQNDKVFRAQIIESLGLSTAIYRRRILYLVENGFLVAHGEKRGRYYTRGESWLQK